MQVLEEAFMVLLVLQGGLSGNIHTDLSRVPAFICTALVHVLRSSILRRLDQVRPVLAQLNVVRSDVAHFWGVSPAFCFDRPSSDATAVVCPLSECTYPTRMHGALDFLKSADVGNPHLISVSTPNT